MVTRRELGGIRYEGLRHPKTAPLVRVLSGKKGLCGFFYLRKCLILNWRTHQELNLKPSDP